MKKPDSPGREILMRVVDVGVCYRRKSGFLRRQRTWALERICLDVRRGETLGLIGRNGAGKSTLMRVMAGIVSPDRGHLEMAEISAALNALNVGLVRSLTGRENAQLSGILLGMSWKQVRASLGQIAEFSGLGDKFNQPVATYSAGMVARLGFSVAYHVRPDILLVDEVWGVGDQEFRSKSTDAMRQMAQSDQTVVIASHGMSLIRNFCDRAAWIEGGRIHDLGPAPEVVARYERSHRPATAGPLRDAAG